MFGDYLDEPWTFVSNVERRVRMRVSVYIWMHEQGFRRNI